VTEFAGATRDELVRYFRAEGMSELALPRRVMVVKTLPVLGTGKADYVKVKAMVDDDEKLGAAA
jgi:acyl-[acyl-carrier-protein]-phospholipid O-acyltransferase/long-chain-fatty-acid--[acyl-carrier-protein] ligase